MAEEVTLETLESLINREDDQPKKVKKKKKSKKSKGGTPKSLDTDLSSLTAAMFGIAGTIGANDEVWTLFLYHKYSGIFIERTPSVCQKIFDRLKGISAL